MINLSESTCSEETSPETTLTQMAKFMWNYVDSSGKRLKGLPDSSEPVTFICGNSVEVGVFSGEEDDFGFWSETGNCYFEAESVDCWVYTKDVVENAKRRKESPLAKI